MEERERHSQLGTAHQSRIRRGGPFYRWTRGRGLGDEPLTAWSRLGRRNKATVRRSGSISFFWMTVTQVGGCGCGNDRVLPRYDRIVEFACVAVVDGAVLEESKR